MLCIPATIPGFAYQYERRDTIAVEEANEVSQILSSTDLAAYANTRKMETVKPHVVTMLYGHGLQLFTNYASYELQRATAGSKISANVQLIYETLFTYAAIASSSKSFSSMHCAPWVISPNEPITFGPGNVFIINPIICLGANDNNGYAVTALVSADRLDAGFVLGRNAGVAGVDADARFVPPAVDLNYLFNLRIGDARLIGPAAYMPCFNGDVAQDPTITLTSQWGNGTRRGTIVMLPSWLFLGDQRERDVRVALFIAMFQPPLCTAAATVNFQVAGGVALEGLMYHNAGTHRTQSTTDMVFVMPNQGTDQTQTIAGRVINMPRYGDRDVYTCRAVGGVAANVLIPAGRRMAFAPGGADVIFSGSAFIGSWRFNESDVLDFVKCLKTYFRCDGDIIAAFDALSAHCVTFARPATLHTADIAVTPEQNLWSRHLMSYRRDYVVTADSGLPVYSVTDGYWRRIYADCRSVSSWISPETMVKPIADFRVIAALLVGFYNSTANQEIDELIYKDLFRGTVNKDALMCHIQTLKLVISDAVYESLGLPPAVLMGTTMRKYCRLDRNFGGVLPAEARRLELQKQFKKISAILNSRLEQNVLVVGLFAQRHSELRKLYASITSVVMFAEYYKLSPVPVPSGCKDNAGGLLFYQNSYTGPFVAGRYTNSRPHDQLLEYGILTGYEPTVAGGCNILPMTSTGIFPPGVHRYYGRNIPKLDLFPGGSELPWSDHLRSLTLSNSGPLGVVIAPTVSNAAGKGHNAPGDFRLGNSTERFLTEQMLNVLTELNLDDYRICTFNDRFVVCGDVIVAGRPSLDHCTRLLPPILGAQSPALSPNNVFARLSLYARRPPVIDSTLSWLYYCISLDDARLMRAVFDQHARRSIGFQYESILSYVQASTNDALDTVWFDPSVPKADIGGERAALDSKDVPEIVIKLDVPPEVPEVLTETKATPDEPADRKTEEST